MTRHKFEVTYDYSCGIRQFVDPGADRCLAIYDTLDECEQNFHRLCEEVHDHWENLPCNIRKHTSYLVYVSCWKVDEDGELTNEEEWLDLPDSDKERINNLSFAYEVR